MKDRLLKLLLCPACRHKLEHNRRANELVCNACQLAYPVRDGIPLLLKMEARSLKQRDNT